MEATKITREQYNEIRDNKDKYVPYLVGWVGFVCGFSAKWFGGFVGDWNAYRFRSENGREHEKQFFQQKNAKSILAQLPRLRGIDFRCCSYDELEIPERSVIYCDPPYQGTTSYKGTDAFDHDKFWAWCRDKKAQGHDIFISEYNAPKDFVCVWQKDIKTQLSMVNVKVATEKLFTLK